MRLAPDVRVYGLKTEILLAVMIAARLYDKKGEDFTITSVIEGKHMSGSLHYVGYAFDIRPPMMSNPIAMQKDIRDALGDDYDVVFEETHIHIEFQPKKAY